MNRPNPETALEFENRNPNVHSHIETQTANSNTVSVTHTDRPLPNGNRHDDKPAGPTMILHGVLSGQSVHGSVTRLLSNSSDTISVHGVSSVHSKEMTMAQSSIPQTRVAHDGGQAQIGLGGKQMPMQMTVPVVMQERTSSSNSQVVPLALISNARNLPEKQLVIDVPSTGPTPVVMTGKPQTQYVQAVEVATDIHICGTCKAQFSDVEHFLVHKQRGCRVMIPTSETGRGGTEMVVQATAQQQGSKEQGEVVQHCQVMIQAAEALEEMANAASTGEASSQAPGQGGQPIISIVPAEQYEAEEARLLETKEKGKSSHPSPQKRFPCQFVGCDYVSKYQKDLGRHYRSHTGHKPYKCDECEKRFTRQDHLKIHKNNHSGNKPYKCDICKCCTHTFQCPMYTHGCPECEKRFTRQDHLKIHKNNHSGNKPYKCDICKCCTHTFQCPMYTHGCPECEKRFTRQDHLKIHKNNHSGNKPYKCDICKCCTHTFQCPMYTHGCPECEKRFTRQDHLKIHKNNHSGNKPYKCDICDYACSEKSSLRKHMRVHTGERPYKCQICPYASKNSSQLIVHLRCHTGDAPFQCHICPAKFKINSDLKRHLRTHTGEKPFTCALCDYKCATKGNLQIHVKINHSGDNQLKCTSEGCTFQTSSQKVYKEHLKVHDTDNPYQCSLCHYHCGSKASLKNHMNIHSEEKPYKCDHCSHTCRQSGNLKVHIRRKHAAGVSIQQKVTEREKKPKKELPRTNRQMCKTMFKCPVCDDRFVREDSFKCHMKQHKELDRVLESTALAVLQLQNPVTSVRASAVRDEMPDTQEPTVSSTQSDTPSSELAMQDGSGVHGEQPQDTVESVMQPLLASENSQNVVSNVVYHHGQERRQELLRQNSEDSVVSGQGTLGTSQGVRQRGRQQDLQGSVSQSFMVPSNLIYSNVTKENPLRAEVTLESSQGLIVPSTMVPAGSPVMVPVGQMVQGTSRIVTQTVSSTRVAGAQKDTAGSVQGQPQVSRMYQHGYQVKSPKQSLVHKAVNQVPGPSQVSETRTPTSNSAVTITHTPLRKTRRPTVRNFLGPESQPSAAVGHKSMQAPAQSQVVYRLSQVALPYDVTNNVQFGNLDQQTLQSQIGQQQVVMQFPVEGQHLQTMQPLNISATPVIVQEDIGSQIPSFGGQQVVVQVPVSQPITAENQMIIPQFEQVQGQPMEHVRTSQVVTSVQNEQRVVQPSQPGHSNQVVVQFPPGNEDGSCYKLVPHLNDRDGTITYCLVRQPYGPGQNPAMVSQPQNIGHPAMSSQAVASPTVEQGQGLPMTAGQIHDGRQMIQQVRNQQNQTQPIDQTPVQRP